MGRTTQANENNMLGEMSIVDTFTKLIFGDDSEFDAQELKIIEVLRVVEGNVSLSDHRDMGSYLRALGVQEMIKLVSDVRRAILNGLGKSVQRSAVSESAQHAHGTH